MANPVGLSLVLKALEAQTFSGITAGKIPFVYLCRNSLRQISLCEHQYDKVVKFEHARGIAVDARWLCVSVRQSLKATLTV